MKKKRDWRNVKHYDYTKKLSSKGWAWEFLRRNKEYIEEWEAALADYLNKLSDENFIKTPRGKRFLFNHENGMVISSIASEHAKKWGLPVYLNPQFSSIDFGKIKNPEKTLAYFFLQEAGYYPDVTLEYLLTENDLTDLKLNSDERAVVFNLSFPLKPQFARMFKKLLDMQNDLKKQGNLKTTYPKNYRDFFLNYIRVFDAKQDKRKPLEKEIAKIIFPKHGNGIKQVQNNFKTVKRYINSDYRKLLP